jgi:8-oxo-dGTP pyrophosphatase MutT (NUDIX family)
MRTIGSQKRETLEEAGYTLISLQEHEAILEDILTGSRSLWHRNDNFAGYVIEINNERYEFVLNLDWA